MKRPQEGQKPQSHRSTGEFCPFSAHTSSPGHVRGDEAREGGSESMGDQGGGLSPGGSPKMGQLIAVRTPSPRLPNNTCSHQPGDCHHNNELIRSGPEGRKLRRPLKPIPVPEALRGTLKGREGASHLSPKEWLRGWSGNWYLQRISVLHTVKEHPDDNFFTFIKYILLVLLWF